MKYELIKGDPATNGIDIVKRTDENGQVWIIPCDESNSDYQAYLATQSATGSATTPNNGERNARSNGSVRADAQCSALQ